MNKKELQAVAKQLAVHVLKSECELLERMAAEDEWNKEDFMGYDVKDAVYDHMEELLMNNLAELIEKEVEKLKVKKTFKKIEGMNSFLVEVK